MSFDTFLDVYKSDFTEYLSRTSSTARSEKRYTVLTEQLHLLYEKHPNVAGIVDMEKPCDLSEQECAALIGVLLIKNELAGLELEQVYFKGCADCVGYLKDELALIKAALARADAVFTYCCFSEGERL